jgi:hypothetical protein
VSVSASLAGGVVASLLVVWLILFQAARLYTTPLAYDDAYLAAAPKSLALGHGYATHYPAPQPFDVRLGVGPALQLPAAALIALFGIRYWVPGLTTVLAINVLLFSIGAHLRRRYPPAARHRIVVAGLLAMAVVSVDADAWMVSHWYALLGDIPASLLVILGVLLLARDLDTQGTPRARTGLVFGLAVQVKLVTTLGIASAIVVGIVAAWRTGRPGRVRTAALFVMATLLPSALTQLWQMWALGGPAMYLEHLAAWNAYFLSEGSGSGVPTQMSLNRWLFARFFVNAAAAGNYLGGRLASVALFVLFGLLAARIAAFDHNQQDRPPEARVASALLLTAALVHGCWWVTLSTTGWINHLLPALLYLAAAFAVALSLPATTRLAIATSVAALLVAIPRLAFLPAYLPTVSRAPGIDSALEVRDAVLAQKAMGMTHVACGWWVPRDIEYLLPDVGNFEDCMRIDRSQFGTGMVVLVRSLIFWNWERNDRFRLFAETCERTTLLRNAHYAVSRCTASSDQLGR